MKINVSKTVEGEFYPIESIFSLDKNLLNGRLAKFSGQCTLKGTFVMTENDVIIDARCKVGIAGECDMCLDEFDFVHEFRVAEGFSLEKNKEGYRFNYSGNEIDLTPAVEEDFLLSFPTQTLCKKDCKGLCHCCGVNLNHTSCGCETVQEGEIEGKNPFAILKEMNIAGGADNGSTKKKNI